jgi:hypothetical protein
VAVGRDRPLRRASIRSCAVRLPCATANREGGM